MQKLKIRPCEFCRRKIKVEPWKLFCSDECARFNSLRKQGKPHPEPKEVRAKHHAGKCPSKPQPAPDPTPNPPKTPAPETEAKASEPQPMSEENEPVTIFNGKLWIPKDKPCGFCGEVFTPALPREKFCSEDCKLEARRKRNREDARRRAVQAKAYRELQESKATYEENEPEEGIEEEIDPEEEAEVEIEDLFEEISEARLILGRSLARAIVAFGESLLEELGGE